MNMEYVIDINLLTIEDCCNLWNEGYYSIAEDGIIVEVVKEKN